MVNIKKQLAIHLRNLEKIKNPKVFLEQYELDSESAAQFMIGVKRYINDGILLDAGCGSGILTISSLLIGFNYVISVDIDKERIKELINNLKKLRLDRYVDWIVADYLRFNLSRKVDAIFMNPPFGTKIKHLDKNFLIKSFSLSNKIFSLHKESNFEFFKKLANDFNFNVILLTKMKILIRRIFSFHRKSKYFVKAEQLFFFRNE